MTFAARKTFPNRICQVTFESLRRSWKLCDGFRIVLTVSQPPSVASGTSALDANVTSTLYFVPTTVQQRVRVVLFGERFRLVRLLLCAEDRCPACGIRHVTKKRSTGGGSESALHSSSSRTTRSIVYSMSLWQISGLLSQSSWVACRPDSFQERRSRTVRR